MATSQFATTCEDKLDPKDERPFIIDLSPALEDGEAIEASFTISPRPEAGLLGLKFFEEPDHPDPVLIEGDRAVQLWIGIEPTFADNAAFDGQGTFLGFEIFADSDAEQKLNRTFKLQVAQL